MSNKQLQRIKAEVEISQLAVSILLANPSFSSQHRKQLAFFLQNRLEQSDFDALSTLSINGRVNFLRRKFHSYLTPG
jgi:hypothetical protein